MLNCIRDALEIARREVPIPPRRRRLHDYTIEEDGHRVIRSDAALDQLAYVTGTDIRDDDLIHLPDGLYRVASVCRCDCSDSHCCRLVPA